MSNKAEPGGYGQFVPGFDFLQKLAQGGNASMAGWLAPTLDPEALDKRISELKAVQFWLDQNAAALKATIQALEVQKMTLAALKTMNVPMPGAGMAWPVPGAAKPSAAAAAKPAAAPAPQPEAAAKAEPSPAAPTPLADPMQYWGALSQQFQQIAGQAMKDAAARSAALAASMPPSAAPAAQPAKKTAPRSRKAS